ncbi:hypothetical protein QQF64_018711 [Cirrhinus molitorella]|uniref:Uncharacterized protein n=1 Tax=Cirrhinus molitorella TaxID=172907 RepID=A0ABR3LEZ5_9TELE
MTDGQIFEHLQHTLCNSSDQGRTGHREHRDISRWPDGRSGLPAAAVQTISLACDRLVCNYELIDRSLQSRPKA